MHLLHRKQLRTRKETHALARKSGADWLRNGLQITLALICLAVQSAMAQSTGSIQGKVTDVSGAPVLGAVITAEAPDGTRHTTITDAEGAFQISSLPLDSYNV